MHPTILLTFTLLSLTASALPLNINLGAYSPALVVGDGAISFEGEGEGEGGEGGNGVANIVNALQGAATNEAGASVANTNGAAVVAGAGNGQAEGAAPPIVAAAVVDAPSGVLNDPTAALPTPGAAKLLDPRE